MLVYEATAINRQHLYRESGGNPGYLKALISEQPVFTARDDLGRLNQTPRFGNYARYTEELLPLRPEMREVIDAAAVVGHEFEAGLLTQMLGRTETEVLGTIGELIRRDRPPGRTRAVLRLPAPGGPPGGVQRQRAELARGHAPARRRGPLPPWRLRRGARPARGAVDQARRSRRGRGPRRSGRGHGLHRPRHGIGLASPPRCAPAAAAPVRGPASLR